MNPLDPSRPLGLGTPPHPQLQAALRSLPQALRRPGARFDLVPAPPHPDWLRVAELSPQESVWDNFLARNDKFGREMRLHMEEWALCDVGGRGNLGFVARSLRSEALVLIGAGATLQRRIPQSASVPVPIDQALPLLADTSLNLVLDVVTLEEMLNLAPGTPISSAREQTLLYELTRVSATTILGRGSSMAWAMARLAETDRGFPFRVHAQDNDCILLRRVATNDKYLAQLESQMNPVRSVRPPKAAPTGTPLDEFKSEKDL